MKTFEEFLLEKAKQLKWDGDPKIGWWEDMDPVVMYHGTHISNIDSVLKNGLNVKDPNTGMISLAFDPNTARGYASMWGGEYNFRRAGAKARAVPMEERVTFVFEIPMKWLRKNMTDVQRGNLGNTADKLTDKSMYDKFQGPDQQYYQLTELRVSKDVPAKFIKGYMLSK